MGRNGFLCLILFMIVADLSSANSLSIRKLSSGASDDAKSSPSPSSAPIVKDPNANQTDDAYKTANDKPTDPRPSNDSSGVNPKGLNNDDKNTSSKSQIDKEKNQVGKGELGGKTNSETGSNESCEGSTRRCNITEMAMVACIQGLESGIGDLVVLVQNEGKSTLKVNITLKGDTKEYAISTSQNEKIDIPRTIGQSTNIVLRSGILECVIPESPAMSEGNFFQRLPSYYKQVTPIYAAYFLFLIALVVGGTLVCCKFRKRRWQDEVPYQELEMGSPGSASLVNADSAEGWDEGWDDDWDEHKAVKSPGGSLVGSISANGLTARTTSREGWEKD